ncbi:reverse transcriptase domain-containing protein [Tanacetum coccineum]
MILCLYKAAMLDPESKKWVNAMNAEMQSMIDNMVWVLVDLPPNCKTVGSKWIFKKKTDMDGNVHIYKARLVEKGKSEEYVTKVIAKDGTVTRFEGRFPHFIEEEEEKKPKPYNLYGFVDLMENEQVYAKNGFAPYRIPQPEGNHNGWLSEEEEADSDSESTASNHPTPFNNILANVNANANNGNGNGENGANGANDANGGNGNNGCTYKSFMSCNPKEYDGKGGAVVLTRWIERMETVIDNSGCAENQKVRYVTSSLVNKALTWWNTQVQARGREAANAMSWNDFKALLVEEFCPSNEMERLENEFWNHKMIRANHAGYTNRFHELAKLVPSRP